MHSSRHCHRQSLLCCVGAEQSLSAVLLRQWPSAWGAWFRCTSCEAEASWCVGGNKAVDSMGNTECATASDAGWAVDSGRLKPMMPANITAHNTTHSHRWRCRAGRKDGKKDVKWVKPRLNQVLSLAQTGFFRPVAPARLALQIVDAKQGFTRKLAGMAGLRYCNTA